MNDGGTKFSILRNVSTGVYMLISTDVAHTCAQIVTRINIFVHTWLGAYVCIVVRLQQSILCYYHCILEV